MKDLLNRFYKNQGSLYKFLLCVASTILIVYLFPKSGKFQFDFQQNKPWQYDNLYAPVDFAILKDKEELEEEQATARENVIPYFTYNQETVDEVKAAYQNQFSTVFTDSIFRENLKPLKEYGAKILKVFSEYGVMSEMTNFMGEGPIYLRRGNEVEETVFEKLNLTDEIA
ncbi:MAG: phosphohydrolase, partial [Leeuwenhoekiella sp.]